ncbi:uncharacterized protein LOC142024523 isoform X2 [Carettochelys insculpta]|uniref:uncharacterized protein LOC142024523 isoform X2 n=1 Tax=Carettochelys insculpta TaxID=44489 RepID=UPI003EB7D0E3
MAAGTEVLEPRSQLALKGAVLELLLSHPEGVPLRDFAGLFSRHHSRCLDLAQHGYGSLRHLLADMKELVVLDEDGEEPMAQYRRPAYNPLPKAKRPRRRHRPRKEVTRERQQSEASGAAPRLWNSCHHLATPSAAPPGPPPAGSAPSAQLPRAISLSHFPSSHPPRATYQQMPLWPPSTQPLGLSAYPEAYLSSPTLVCSTQQLHMAAHPEAYLSSPTLGPSRLTPPASPHLAPSAPEQAELEQNVAQVLRGYPDGISLFHFRQAYGATYSHAFPLDSSASVKEQLAAMPGTVRVEGWGVQTMLYLVCPPELPRTTEEMGLSPFLPGVAAPLASPGAALAAPAAVCQSSSIAASPTESAPASEGLEQPPAQCSPPAGHRVAPGGPAECLVLLTAPAAPWSPETGLEHAARGHVTEETVVMEGVTTATPGAVPSELAAELPLPLASPAFLSSAGSLSVPPPLLSLDHLADTDAVLYGLNSVSRRPSCPRPEPSTPPTLPRPISVVPSPQPLTVTVSTEPAWSPLQGVSDSPREIPPFRSFSLGVPILATPYSRCEDRGAPRGAIKPEPCLPPISLPHPPPVGSKRKPSKHKPNSCVLL